jgi:hypothetical protein
MALFIFKTGLEAQAEMDIATIAGPDSGGVGDTQPVNQSFVQMTFAQGSSGVGQNMLDQIINKLPTSRPIIVFPQNGTFVFMGHPFIPDGTPLTQITGLTWSFPPDPNVYIVYDVTQCNFAGYTACDSAGATISAPNHIILFHEFSHALHGIDGTMPAGQAAQEFQAITDENALRADVAPNRNALPLRDPNNHACGGCGGAGTPPDCFIVSAAVGSQKTARETARFNRIRDLFIRASILGEAFFANLWTEYYQFSVEIVVDMSRSSTLKDQMSTLIVAPFLDVLALFQLRVQQTDGGLSFNKAAGDIFALRSAEMETSKCGTCDIAVIIELLTQTSERLGDRNRVEINGEYPIPPSRSDPACVLEYLALAVEARTPSSVYTTWAILGPVILYWVTLGQFRKGQIGQADIGDYLGSMIDKWLGDVPIPSAIAYLTEESLRDELKRLSQTIFTRETARRRFGKRILVDYQKDIRYSLETVLYGCGY